MAGTGTLKRRGRDPPSGCNGDEYRSVRAGFLSRADSASASDGRVQSFGCA
jgi:hypothetical protein